VALLVLAGVFGLVAVAGWWRPSGWHLPRVGWKGTEQAGGDLRGAGRFEL